MARADARARCSLLCYHRYELLPVPAAPSAQDSDAGFVSYKYAQKLPFLVERSDIGKGPGDGSIIRLTAAHHSNDRKKGSIFLWVATILIAENKKGGSLKGRMLNNDWWIINFIEAGFGLPVGSTWRVEQTFIRYEYGILSVNNYIVFEVLTEYIIKDDRL